MHFLSLLPLLGLAAAAPLTSDSAPSKLSSLDPSTGKPITSPSNRNSTFRTLSTQAASSSWWYAALDHSTGAVRDYVPNLYTGMNPDYDYPTYIAVTDAAGLRSAIYSNGPNGQRYNGWLAGQPRTIYVAPGTYTLSETLYMDTDTVIIGDAANPPTIKASSNFNGQEFIVAGVGGDGYAKGEQGELKFSLMIKNLILDTTANAGNKNFRALSWRVAQNSALVNMQINMPQGAHTGISMGQGSTIQAGDVRFSYGSVGLHYAGHQQASLKNLQFSRCSTGILIDSGETVSIFAPTFDTVGNSIVFNSGAPWVSVIDAVSKNSGTFFTSNVGYPNFMLENISKDTTDTPMVVVNKVTKIGGQTKVGTYVYGNTYGASPTYQDNPSIDALSRPSILAPGGKYPVSSAPQYASATINDVINLKDKNQNGGQTIAGNGQANDGPGLQIALNTAASQGKIAYLPYGTYRTEVTITIPSGTRLVGNGWSTIAGAGDLFKSIGNPKPIVKIGNSGDVGKVDIQDMRFTIAEQLPGAIVLEVNMKGNSPGDVAIHNSMITIGGTRDTTLNCGTEAQCKAAYLGMHLTATSSAYIDNVWAWVADHNSDNDDGNSNKDIRAAVKGGVLVESTQGTWIVGLGSEHFWLYQLAYNNAKNVFVSFFQSETNYHQGSRADIVPPGPFNDDLTDSDPTFSYCSGQVQCPMGPAQYFNGGSNIYSYASGSWNFYGGLQASMNVINKAVSNLRLYGLCDHTDDKRENGGHYVMRLPDGTRFGDGSNDGYGGSWGSLVAKYTS